MSHRIRRAILVACLHAGVIPKAVATPVDDADELMRQERFGEAARIYDTLITASPRVVKLRLARADALAMDRQWDRAIAEYRIVLQLAPGNAEALRGIARVERWRGQTTEALQTYKEIIARQPDGREAVLGLASTYALDHDFAAAQEQYDFAYRRWPNDAEVQQAAYDFTRERNPRLYVFYEDDLSFTTKQAGAALPFGGREEIGVEWQDEARKDYRNGGETYSRTDNRLLYTHFFALNHSLDFFFRASQYDYTEPVTDFVAIDTFEEYRVRYTVPVTADQAVAIRYSARPTTLKVTQETFTAHKLEAELRTRWVPRFRTVLGSGWLRDLNPDASSVSDLKDTTLVKVEAQYDLTNRLGLSGKYITNPDLDNTVRYMRIVQLSYSFDGPVSALARYRFDNYKTGDDQTAWYLGLRFVPNSHFWSEFGVKTLERGDYTSNDPLVSLVYRF